jgi:trigger factor
VHDATVTDTDGNVIDTTEFFGPPGAQAEQGAAEESDEAASESDEAADEVSADAK